MKKSARNRIIIWSIVSFLLISVLVLGLVFIRVDMPLKMRYLGSIRDNSLSYSGDSAEFSVDEVSEIEINWVSGDITFEESDYGKIEISEKSNNKFEDSEMRYQVDDGKLTVDFGKDMFRFINFRGSLSKNLTVKVPKGYVLDKITAKSASANFKNESVNAESTVIESASGEINIGEIKGDSLKANSISGDIEINGADFADVSVFTTSGECKVSADCKKLKTESVSGDVNASLSNKIEEIDASSVSGDINIRLPENTDGFTVDKDTVSGNFDSDFSVSSKNGKYKFGNGRIEIKFKTVSGDISISK